MLNTPGRSQYLLYPTLYPPMCQKQYSWSRPSKSEFPTAVSALQAHLCPSPSLPAPCSQFQLPGTALTFHNAPWVQTSTDSLAFSFYHCVAANDSKRSTFLEREVMLSLWLSMDSSSKGQAQAENRRGRERHSDIHACMGHHNTITEKSLRHWDLQVARFPA